ncbi:hypothetical protein [Novosphingobium terrae]|uniref:hypothetical protein n=1 Tax=Novosphingobium terrae TaxID=2726189 RepID=UPI00197EC5AD|nr:hypothetical protein [Novosphingobium terrae]
MRDIDDLLARLGDLPPDPRVESIDADRLSSMARAAPVWGGAGLGVVAGLALLLGVASSLPGHAKAASPTMLGLSPDLIPSALLEDRP